jgi:hypothetical protein
MTDRYEIAVGREENNVILKIGRVYNTQLGQPTVDIMCIVPIDIQGALDIAEAMAGKAFECEGMIPKAGEALKVELAERHAKKLVPKIVLMLRSLHDKNLQYQAEAIVGECLSEVLG